MIHQVTQTALVPYTPTEMFQLVSDIASYAAFLPGCLSSAILEEKDQQVLGKLEVGHLGFSRSFVTRNTLSAPEKIDIALVEGPFLSLSGCWEFKPLGEKGCKVSLELVFELDNGFLKTLVSKIFDKASQKLVNAFVDRAVVIYGERTLY
jgi:ribosome-associated toxin RatA of RatAB toxin-antitoxin module